MNLKLRYLLMANYLNLFAFAFFAPLYAYTKSRWALSWGWCLRHCHYDSAIWQMGEQA